MENRRPPRNSSSGQKQFQDKNRRPASDRSGQFHRSNSRSQQSGTTTRGGGFNGRNGKFTATSRGGPVKPAEENLIPIISDLQITDGKYRGKFLQNSVSVKVRPTMRKLREIMFKVVSRRVHAGRFLDLGSGPGTIGIEAISRGAMLGTFVEKSAKMCSFIRKNIKELGIKSGHAEVVEMEIVPFLKKMAARHRQWDLVYFGTRDAAEDTFSLVRRGAAIKQGGLLMIEHTSEQEFPDEFGSLKKWRTIGKDGLTITFYQKK
jgi:16S rRNA (guanine966-N2)-methyltransferase